MPEYLAPGVYLEEVDSGAKPIEGVSTSTVGIVGMAERGPTDVPILITSMGEFDRWFGGYLNRDDFTDAADRIHCYLPHAVEGFFTNGGKRLYTVRVAPDQATRANGTSFWRDPAVALGETVLLRGAGQGTGNAVPLYILSNVNLLAGDTIRIGDGSAAEYRDIAAITVGTTQHIPLSGIVTRAHAAGTAIQEHAPTAVPGLVAPALAAIASAAATELTVDTADDLMAFLAGPPPAGDGLNWLIQLAPLDGIVDIPVATHVESVGIFGGLNRYRLVLNQPLQRGYPVGHAMTILRSEVAGARVLETDATPGDLMIFADVNGAGAGIVEVDQGTGNHEAFANGTLGFVALAQPLPFAAASRSVLEQVTLADDGAIAATATSGTANSGSRVLSLTNRVGLLAGQVIRIGVANAEEYAVIVSVPGERGSAPDAGTVTLAQPLTRTHGPAIGVQVQLDPVFPAGGNPMSRLVLEAPAGASQLLVTDVAGWAAGEFVRLTSTNGEVAFFRAGVPPAAVAPAAVQLVSDLARSHPVGSAAVERLELFDVQALDVGAWGNRLSLSAETEARGLADTRALVLTLPLQFTVESLTGLEAGSLVEVRNPANGNTVLRKVRRIDRANGAVILDLPGLDPAAMATLGAIVDPLEIRSREFRLTVNLRRRPDPAVPSRNALTLASETFQSLSMDHRHSRYFEQIIGATNGTLRLEDNRPEGESAFIRVRDRLDGLANEQAYRTGPETLTDLLPGGIVQPAKHTLSGGDDSLATMTGAVYLGADNAEPKLRTGLASMRNIAEVSLVAIPGQTAPDVQAGLISHCEQMRYRFAVLDSADADASLNDVRNQRQQFDTRYAALYYPWLTIPDPSPANLANIGNFALPPSGHVLGLIARVDNERGVHKAPANEVVRGITGLTRTLQKGEHDILNPSPTNINVIRDFRPDGRSIRLFGARCITSDQEHKYVNVRRLLIFLEQSIERGLQWVVFEPNAEPLWARVTQTVTNFLTDVWRAGALEGTEPGQGFFVKCDLTTMTQSDIDNGRLICVIGVAPVKPAEFVIIRIGLTTRTTENA